MITTTLDGQWKLKAVSPMIASGLEKGSEWNMNIPGSLHDTLLAENLIKEPYDGLESEKSRWIGESLWSVERTFNFERSEGPVFFKCGGLSACRININGKTAAEKHDASPLLLDISEYITSGENKIEIFFLPQLDKSISYPGIWRSIKLLSDPVLIIAGSEAETENRNGKWLLDVIIPAIAEKDTETEYTISINGKTETGKIVSLQNFPASGGQILFFGSSHAKSFPQFVDIWLDKSGVCQNSLPQKRTGSVEDHRNPQRLCGESKRAVDIIRYARRNTAAEHQQQTIRLGL